MALQGSPWGPDARTHLPSLNSPTQFLPSGLSSKPALQMHRKVPTVLTQRP